MKLNKNTKLLFQILFFFIYGCNCNAQNYKNADSLINIYSNQIYKNPDKVIEVGKKIIENADNNIDTKIKAFKLISDGYSSKRDYQKSLEYVIKAEQLLHKTNNKLLKISIVLKAGIQYQQLKIYDKSIQFLDQSEKMCLEYPNKDSVAIQLGINHIVRGFIYKDKLNCDIAIAFFNKGINEISQSKSKKNHLNIISIAKYNIGNCYILMSENDLAINSFKESFIFANNINAASLKAFALKGLAQVYTLQSKYDVAIKELFEAKKISNEVNDLILNQEIYKGLAENYLALNDWNMYKKFHRQFLTIQTKLKERERKSISNLIIDKEKSVNKNIQMNFSNSVFIYLSLFSVAIIILFIFLILKIKKQISLLSVRIDILQINEVK